MPCGRVVRWVYPRYLGVGEERQSAKQRRHVSYQHVVATMHHQLYNNRLPYPDAWTTSKIQTDGIRSSAPAKSSLLR